METRVTRGVGGARLAALTLGLALAFGCGSGTIGVARDGGADRGPAADGGPADATTADAPADAAPGDAGPADGGGVPDGAGPDGAAADAGPQDAAPVEVLLRVTFDQAPLGAYGAAQIEAEWPAIQWSSSTRAAIVDGSDAYQGRSLRILYPAGGVGPDEGGAQWMVRFPTAYAELYCAYRVRFGDGFGFVKGGKLPGLAGGAANTGGEQPTGTDGWSARMMWRTGGAVVQYVYHPDQPTVYGDDFPWDVGGQRAFAPGTWHLVEHRVVMNTPGQHDGLVQGWFDGVLALERPGVRFRDVDTFAIDVFYFSTFFGGSDSSWAPSRDEYVYFDEFVVATGPIGH
jgi:hypothetical protein